MSPPSPASDAPSAVAAPKPGAATPKQPAKQTVKPKAEKHSAKHDLAAIKEFEDECTAALAVIEEHIYEQEETYQEENPQGTIARGWEGFLDVRPGGVQKRRVDDRDRIFSMSSWTFTSRNPTLFAVDPRGDRADSGAGRPKRPYGAEKRPYGAGGEGGEREGATGQRKKRKIRATTPRAAP
ncbi:hypothetical protein M885DRAFT_528135 [Pelagophyceae sp. CCMP2097]|nr:hypothetical protein M885DRAFT_528135 [Pelagophyceae sp. CCMP2097]|mmetsp:Transcript_10754/g.35779  ORF Transcript_10754/g.35779 Transcript_10754/m.35779 type:complete len:182 (+) Transcript_10754:195-740(+)